jgi:hypothetical protein
VQGLENEVPHSAQAEFSEVIVDGGPRRKVVG